ncbi:MAG: type III secretion system export apparatus subunit SctR [Alphaproteobacteria bacterium GM7ARS4]|nr:type III secretion system export apparatus subunit SctR [Alphaproteobacteria bacterium GM7ARS4]
MTDLPQTTNILLLLSLVSLIPIAVLMTTSFVKIAIVLALVRNALGVQQIPPNMALYGLALILTLYIMAPTLSAMAERAPGKDFSTLQSSYHSVTDIAQPLKGFLAEHTHKEEHRFFLETIKRIWPPEMAESLPEDSFATLIPAFMISELTSAFEIGFLLYLPFIVIDLIVSNLLLAMGMMMVSPLTISLPLKLFLFVVVDGWSQLARSLILTYGV